MPKNKYLSQYNYSSSLWKGLYRLDYNNEKEGTYKVSLERFLEDFENQFNLEKNLVCYISKKDFKKYEKINIEF